MPTAMTYNVHVSDYALMFVIVVRLPLMFVIVVCLTPMFVLVVCLPLYFLQLGGFENIPPFSMDGSLNYWW